MTAKEHGILMSASMVRAYLAGLKSQTRRTRGLDKINADPDEWMFAGFALKGEVMHAHFERPIQISSTPAEPKLIKLPYGEIGDMLYFKETYALGQTSIVYRANYLDGGLGADSVVDLKTGDLTPLVWKPSIFMNRKYSRIVKTIMRVRVERLQEITGSDCYCEGVGVSYTTSLGPEQWQNSQRELYSGLWDDINGKKLPWSYNPWVWVYEFERHIPERDDLRDDLMNMQRVKQAEDIALQERMCATCGHSESRHQTAGGFCEHCTCNEFVEPAAHQTIGDLHAETN